MSKDDSRFEPNGTPREDPHLLRLLDEWSELLERAARGELDENERAALDRACEENGELREALEDARFSRQLFARVRPAPSPRTLGPRILDAIEADNADPGIQASRSPASIRSRHFGTARQRHPRVSPRWWGPAAAAAVVLLALLLPGRMNETDSEAPESSQELARVDSATRTAGPAAADYSEAELRTAAEEMRIALALVARTMDRTSQVLRSEMREEVRNRVTQPIEEGIETGLRAIPMLRTIPRDDEHSRILSPPRGDC